MTRSRFARLPIALFLAAWCAAAPAQGASPEAARADDESARLVRSALRFEAAGDAAYRGIMLKLALSQFSDCAPARWHSGFVQVDGAWRTLAEAEAQASADEKLNEYTRRREEAFKRESAAAHLGLARWCLRNALDDQARYHLAQVFRLPAAPEQLREAAERMSFKLLREQGAPGVLVGEVELQRRAEQAGEAQAAWLKWEPELLRIAAATAAPEEATRSAAYAELAQINDPAAAFALESLVSTRGEAQALAVVQTLATMPEHAATMSLARHAVFSPAERVREAAIAQLEKRPLHDYAPWLLSGLISPVKSRFWVQPLPGGNFQYLHDFYREGASREFFLRKQVQVTAVPDLIFFRGFGNPDPAQAKMVDGPDALIPPEMMKLELAADAVRMQEKVLLQNQRAEFINKRIDAVLTRGAGQQMNADPVRWWEWWQQYNELQTPDKKQLVASYSSTEMTYPGAGRVVQYIPSCFPAGTIVWAEAGGKPIEAIQGGDRVLSQDVETGELAYKTVLGTTIRPPTPLAAIGVGGSEIRATKGHPFWISGKGWQMAKFLAPGDRLHGVNGFLPIETIAEARAEPAYNLIVEDFATYFVGEQRLLVHDNTLRTPTLAVVPGLTAK